MNIAEIKGHNVAITGGTGCLGQPLFRKLHSVGCSVRLLVPTEEHVSESIRGAQIVRGDINNAVAISRLLEGVDVVFHLAAKVHDFEGRVNSEFERVNIDGTRLLLRQAGAAGVKRLVMYSTVGVYGKDGDFRGDEQSPCQPQTPYSISKHSAEQMVLSTARGAGPEGVVLRFPVAYGELDRGNMFRMIDAIRRHRFVVFGSGLNVRSMISAVNASEAAVLAGFMPNCAGKVYCVTDGVDYTFNQLVDSISKCLSTSWRPPKIPLVLANAIGKVGDIYSGAVGRPAPFGMATVRKLSTNLTFSCERIKRELGYMPIQSLAEGIAQEVKWILIK